jgi:hypothetical protein
MLWWRWYHQCVWHCTKRYQSKKSGIFPCRWFNIVTADAKTCMEATHLNALKGSDIVYQRKAIYSTSVSIIRSISFVIRVDKAFDLCQRGRQNRNGFLCSCCRWFRINLCDSETEWCMRANIFYLRFQTPESSSSHYYPRFWTRWPSSTLWPIPIILPSWRIRSRINSSYVILHVLGKR